MKLCSKNTHTQTQIEKRLIKWNVNDYKSNRATNTTFVCSQKLSVCVLICLNGWTRFIMLHWYEEEIDRSTRFTYRLFVLLTAVQNERQPRNTATIRPEAFRDMEQSRALREAAVAVGVFAWVSIYITARKLKKLKRKAYRVLGHQCSCHLLDMDPGCWHRQVSTFCRHFCLRSFNWSLLCFAFMYTHKFINLSAFTTYQFPRQFPP